MKVFLQAGLALIARIIHEPHDIPYWIESVLFGKVIPYPLLRSIRSNEYILLQLRPQFAFNIEPGASAYKARIEPREFIDLFNQW